MQLQVFSIDCNKPGQHTAQTLTECKDPVLWISNPGIRRDSAAQIPKSVVRPDGVLEGEFKRMRHGFIGL
jgi:hypothetical protein